MKEVIIFLVSTFIILILGYYIIVYRFHVKSIKKFELLISYLGGISVLLIIYNLYITIESNNRIEKNRMSYNTIENIQKNYLGPQKELLDQYPESYFLYASMNLDTDLNQHLPEPEEFDLDKRRQVEIYGSLRVYQALEDFLSTAAFDITGNYSWINNFLVDAISNFTKKLEITFF